MPQPPNVKTGQDYTRILTTLAKSNLVKDNPQAFQSIKELIDGARSFQGFIDERFPQLDGSTGSLFTFVTQIIDELINRNNSKYSVSLTSSVEQSLPSGVNQLAKFDTVIFDDGLMQSSPTDITLNENGQYMIVVRCKFIQ